MNIQKKINKKIFNVIIFIIFILISLYIIINIIIFSYAKNIDNDLKKCSINFSSTIYYYNKNQYTELQKLNGNQNRSWASISEIPNHLKNAFIAIEDKRFYLHKGIDFQRTFSAILNWFFPLYGNFGGSTITQQLIKNITSENSLSIKRKFFEIFKALALEKKQNKNTILEFYLNTIYLGKNIYGVKIASKIYFNKHLSDLNLAESAIIAAITNNPSYYNPFIQTYNVISRQKIILNEMLNQKLITNEEYNNALNYKVVFSNKQNYNNEKISQSYFVDELISNVINDLILYKGYSKQLAQFLIYSGGLKIYSTLDNDIQKILENIFQNQKNFPNVKGKNNEKPEASIVIINPYNGYVVGLIGGRGEKNGNLIINRATQTKRSPGSIIKPISVYAPAIDMNIITPYSVWDDIPFYYNNNIWPKNHYNSYNGKMSIMKAVEISNNTIPVYILEKITLEKSFEYLNEKLNINSLVKKYKLDNNKIYTDVGYAQLALGGLSIGISVLEITSAYCPFVNNGYYYKPILYTDILDSNGNLLFKNTSFNKKIYENEKTTTYMNLLLKNVVDNGTAKKAKLNHFDTAGKTGTTSETFDRWFVGYTPYYVAACWFGYDIPQTITNVNNNPALELWYKSMNEIHKKLKPQKFNNNIKLISANYCIDSGYIPNQNCYLDIRGNRVHIGYYYYKDIPKTICNIHKNINIDILTGFLASEFCPYDNIKQISILDFKRKLPEYIYIKDNEYSLLNKNFSLICHLHKSLKDNIKTEDVENIDTIKNNI